MEQIVATLANVSASATSVTLQAANASRHGWCVVNDSAATLYIAHAGTASATSFTVAVGPSGYYELPVVAGGKTGRNVYTGIITGLWSSATGSARVTEYV